MIQILPTDTCYGLAGDFTLEDFYAINTLKWRDETKRLALLVEDFGDMKRYVGISDEQISFLREYPHPWSFLGKRNPECILPDYMDRQKYEMISLRIGKNCIHANIRDKLTNPLFLTSANLSGWAESTTLEEATKAFPWVSWYDGGLCDWAPSDIFSIGEDGEIVYLRRNYGI